MPILRRLLLGLAFLGIFTYSFSYCVLSAYYQLNKEYIAQKLCVQKEQKKNTCQGKCHLKKMTEQQKQTETGHDAPAFVSVFVAQALFRFEIAIFGFTISKSLQPEYKASLCLGCKIDFLHPPIA